MSASSVNLIIKSPNDKIPSQTVSCPFSWTVLELKTHLSECYPSNPSPSSQRLIHAGKLLKDETVLKSIFQDLPCAQTVHLVCRSVKTFQQQCGTPLDNADHIGDIATEEMAEYQRGYYEYLQQFYMNNGDRYSSTGSSAVSFSNYPVQNPWIPYTMAGHVAQNMWYPPAAVPPVSQNDTDAMPPNPEHVPGPAQGNQWLQGARAFLADLGVGNGDNANQAANQPQQQAMMVGNPMAGGFMGAEEMGENGGNMDIVDRFYMLFRLCLFIGLCFAYSSLDKAIIVFSVAAYVYFYNIYRRHAAVRQAAAQVQQAQAQPTEQPMEPAQVPPDEEGSTDQQVRQRVLTEDQTPTSNLQPLPLDPEPRFARLTGTLRLVANTSYQFVSSLIASLIPEQPPPMRLD